MSGATPACNLRVLEESINVLDTARQIINVEYGHGIQAARFVGHESAVRVLTNIKH